MILTDIRETKKGRFALFCDGEFLFSVDDGTLLMFHLVKGMAITDETLLEIRQQSDYQKAMDQAFRYLSVRDHSSKELSEKLAKKYDAYTCSHTIERLKELELLDDHVFASRYYQELLRKGKSYQEAVRRLREKGITQETLDSILSADDFDETSRIRELVASKYQTKLAQENGEQKVIAALVRRGFRLSDIRKVLREEGDEWYEP